MIIWLVLACVDVEGWSETRLLIAVVAVEVLSEDNPLLLYCTLSCEFSYVQPYSNTPRKIS